VSEKTAADSKGIRAVSGVPSVRTFLIADIRGYTKFSQEHGDDAASHVARRFAEIVQEGIAGKAGLLLELRGDEALCVFNSARDALRAAVELQVQFRRQVKGEPNLPLGVGVGLDAGEAVPVGDGYRGRALNVAARLCALAQAGEVLATETVVSLAGHQTGMGFASRRPARLKGLAAPLRYVEVVPEVALPPVPAPPRPERGRRHKAWWQQRGVLVGCAIALLVVSGGAVITVLRAQDEGVVPVSVVPNSLAVIDPKANRVVADIPVGDGPASIAVGEGSVWVRNAAAGTISRVDPKKRELVKTFAVGATPADIAAGLGSVWVGDGATSTVLQLDPDSGVVRKRIQAPPIGDSDVSEEKGDAGGVAVSAERVWFLSGLRTVSSIEPTTGHVLAQLRYSLGVSLAQAWIDAAEKAVWISACCGGVTRIDPQTKEIDGIDLPAAGPLAAGLNGVWVAGTIEAANDPRFGAVWHLDLAAAQLAGTIRCKGHALDVAVGQGSIWIACSDGAVLRVDPASAEVAQRIPVGGIPAGIAVGEGAVWVSVD
jgi:YVTN family beta-propeller protein